MTDDEIRKLAEAIVDVVVQRINDNATSTFFVAVAIYFVLASAVSITRNLQGDKK